MVGHVIVLAVRVMFPPAPLDGSTLIPNGLEPFVTRDNVPGVVIETGAATGSSGVECELSGTSPKGSCACCCNVDSY